MNTTTIPIVGTILVAIGAQVADFCWEDVILLILVTIGATLVGVYA